MQMKKGFTLIELLVVIGILAVLLTITLVAINPQRQFQQSNDTKRQADVNAVLNAITQYAADNRGTLPSGITTTPQTISSTGANLCGDLVTEYLAALPTDPTSAAGGTPVTETGCAAAYDTGYSVSRSATDNRVTVTAVGQITNPISVTR